MLLVEDLLHRMRHVRVAVIQIGEWHFEDGSAKPNQHVQRLENRVHVARGALVSEADVAGGLAGVVAYASVSVVHVVEAYAHLDDDVVTLRHCE